MPAAFHLDKWYLDVVTDDGLCVIAYRAVVKYRALRLNYAAVMIAPPRGAREVRSSLRGGPEPVISGERLVWSCPAMGVRIGMERTVPGVARRLEESDLGVINWDCCVPGARVRLEIDGCVREGTGYAERLTMTVPPHRLPIRTLRWGRCISDDALAAVAWIQWRGPKELDLIVHDGAAAVPMVIADTLCGWRDRAGAEHELALGPGRALSGSEPGASIIETIPMVRRFAPPIVRAALGIRETKWLARATLSSRGGGVSSGWAIHETVTFPENAA